MLDSICMTASKASSNLFMWNVVFSRHSSVWLMLACVSDILSFKHSQSLNISLHHES